jgi:hypothetical protein
LKDLGYIDANDMFSPKLGTEKGKLWSIVMQRWLK